MEIKKIVLHHIDKELKGKASLNCSKKLITVNETVTEFVEKLIKIYGSKNPSQGTFEDDITNFPFQTKATKYLKDQDFLKLTVEAMDILKSKIDINTTTGGYVVFIHYEHNQVHFLITAMMDKSIHYTNTDDLGIKKLMALDIEKMARANRLNFDKWAKKEGRYLTFIKGTRDLSQYFIKFIGASDISSAKENFDKLKDAVKKYSVANKLPLAKQSKIRESISEYVEKCFTQKRDVEIESIAAIIDSEEPTAFLGFIEDNDIEISGKIGVHAKSDYYSFTRSSVKEDGYHLVFEKELIKKGKITREGTNIIIHNVPMEKLNTMFDGTLENKI
ncbi:nucleoid-associated protein [Flavobacterium sp. RSP29]|uniref:nucleoid-associated protein n=1 Tax=Flavobacterium sp. RSP29 TaxID=3401731 RepID=UPI003AAC3F7D